MKWLWMLWPDRLWLRVVQGDLAERDVADGQVEGRVRGAGVGERAGTIVASGYRAAAIAAVIGSSSTPVMRAAGGAKPMKLPEPQPGSRTRPPVKPSCGGCRPDGLD